MRLVSLVRKKQAKRHDQNAGSPLELHLPSIGGNTLYGQGNDLGYGKNDEDWVIRSQVLPCVCVARHIHSTDAVQRLDVRG